MAYAEAGEAFAPDRFDLEGTTAEDCVALAVEHYGSSVVVAASFQDCVLIDVATGVCPDIEVVFLDTGFHFPETLAYVELVRRRYSLNLTVVGPPAADCPACGTAGCCQRRKVEPLARALAAKRAWMSGVRRADSPQRGGTPVAMWDSGRGLMKFNPLATWSDQDVVRYVRDRDLPVHPLTGAGYPSIGCAPTTVAVDPGRPSRAGRWPGSDKTECGIHL